MLPRRIPGQCIRTFSTTRQCASNVGQKRLTLPPNVTLSVTPPPPPKLYKYFKPTARHHPLGGDSVRESDDFIVTVTGPLGSLQIPIPEFMSIVPAWTVNARLASVIAEKEALGTDAPERNDLAIVVKDDRSRKQREMWGTVRALLTNSIKGVSEGHRTTLTLKGVGYRAALVENGKRLELKVGHNHNVYTDIPELIQLTMTNPTVAEVKCIDKEKMGLFCANVRKHRPPEPYKGKVFFHHQARLTHRVFLSEPRLSRSRMSRRNRQRVVC
jgi:large subunit ribosomal protein L6